VWALPDTLVWRTVLVAALHPESHSRGPETQAGTGRSSGRPSAAGSVCTEPAALLTISWHSSQSSGQSGETKRVKVHHKFKGSQLHQLMRFV